MLSDVLGVLKSRRWQDGANKEKEMPVTCDRCGKEASIKNKPDGVHWRDWMSESSRGEDAMVIIPCGDEELGVICMTCVQVQLDEWNESRTDEPPNAELTGVPPTDATKGE